MMGTIYRNWIWSDDIRLNQDIVSKSPDKPRAHINLAEAYLHRGRLDEALSQFEETIPLAKSRGESGIIINAYVGISNIYSRQGKFDKAWGVLIECLNNYPPNALVISNLIFIQNAVGHPKDAVKFVQDIIASKDQEWLLTPPVLYNYAISLAMTGECDLADNIYGMATLADRTLAAHPLPKCVTVTPEAK